MNADGVESERAAARWWRRRGESPVADSVTTLFRHPPRVGAPTTAHATVAPSFRGRTGAPDHLHSHPHAWTAASIQDVHRAINEEMRTRRGRGRSSQPAGVRIVQWAVVLVAERPFVDEANGRSAAGSSRFFDLVVDHRRFEAAEPEAAAEWLGSYEIPDRVGVRRITGIALTLWVDGGGIGWQWESNSDVHDDFARGEIVRFDDEPFVLEPPAELVDPGPLPAEPLTPIPDDQVERPVDPVDQPLTTVSA